MKYFPVNEFTKPKLVIGEGHDEWSFFNAVINHLQLGDQLATEQYGGRYKLADGLRAIEERPGFRKNITSLAVTRDADFLDDPQASSEAVIQAAFQSVCG